MKATAKPLGGGGSLSVDAARWLCILAGEKYLVKVAGGKKPVRVPADSYKVLQYQLHATADTSRRGPMIYGHTGTKPFEVAEGETAELGIGSPIQAAISTRQKAGSVTFSLSQTDAAGTQIAAVLGEGGKRSPAPKIDVVSKAGKTVYTAKLEYG